MSKYGPGLRMKDVCKLECEEAEKLLNKLQASDEEKDVILGMIKEAWHQAQKAALSGRAMEELREKWIDTRKAMPELNESGNSKLVLAAMDVFTEWPSYDVCYFNAEKGWRRRHHEAEVTHWMPLPDGPLDSETQFFKRYVLKMLELEQQEMDSDND